MVYFMRHGETAWNHEHRLQGRTDIPLSEKGIADMENAGNDLKEVGFSVDHIISSPLKRARETAEIIARKIGFCGEVLTDENLLERSFGKAEGKLINEDLDLSDKSFGVESAEHLCARVNTVLRNYMDDDSANILIVTHGAFIMAIMDVLGGRPLREQYNNLPRQGVPISVGPAGEISYLI